MSKTAMAVARVSTSGQKDNYSPRTQLAAMRDYATKNGYGQLLEIEDVCSGTTPIYDRPGGKQIYRAIRNKSIDALIFYTFDRASRDEYAIDFMILQRDLSEAGIELHITDKGKIGDDPMSRMMAYWGVTQAAEERKKIKERSARGLKAKAKEKWIGYALPYGYRRTGFRKDAAADIDEETAAVVRRIFALYLGIGCEALPQKRIAMLLMAEKVPPPLTTRATRGRGWHIVTIKRIIDNRAYIGEFNNGGEIIKLPHLAIIDREVWEAAQRQRERNKERCKRNRKHEYLMSGRLDCFCGGVRSGHTMVRSSGTYVYYECGEQRYQRYMTTCREGDIRAEIIDTKVWDWLYGLLGSDKQLAHGLRRKAEREAAENQPKRERLETVRKLIAETERRIRVYMDDFGDEKDETIRAEVKLAIKTAAKQKEQYTAERERLEADLLEVALSVEQEKELLKLAAELREGMIEADFETKRYFLKRLDVQGKLRRDGAGKAWLDVSCGLTLDTSSFEIESQSGQSLKLNRRTVVFAASLPLDGQPAGDLAEALFMVAGVPVTR